jgi:hypothetical protein
MQAGGVRGQASAGRVVARNLLALLALRCKFLDTHTHTHNRIEP